jgi:hypothetical protein
MDLKVTLGSQDLEVENGDLVLCRSPSEAALQDINIRLRTLAGEWFLDPQVGVPYFTKVFGQRPNKLSLLEIFKHAVLESSYVIDVTNANVEFDESTNSITVSFAATLADGSTLVLRESLGGPYA